MQVDKARNANEIPDRGETLRKGFRIGEWVVRPIEGLIDGRLGSRHLQPKSMDVLVCLACSPNHIVEREELIEQVWGHTAVTDEPLTRCIHDLRRELSDTRDHPTYIQTIPKRGYRLIADVEPADELPAPDAPVAQQESGTGNVQSAGAPVADDRLFLKLIKHRVAWVGAIYAICAWLLTRVAVYAKPFLVNSGAPDWSLTLLMTVLLLGFPVTVFLAWAYEEVENSPRSADGRGMFGLLLSRRGIDLAAITLLLGALAFMALDLRQPPPAFTSAQEPNRVAVLPFAVESEQSDWLGEGIAEDLMNLLGGVEDLEIASWTSSSRPFPESADVRDIGHDLNVHYMLTGKIYRDEDRLRICAQLLDAQTGYRLWSETFDRRPGDLFAIQEEIAGQALVAMQSAMPIGTDERRFVIPGTGLQSGPPPTTSMTAYDHYQQARIELRQPATQESLEAAAAHFTKAIQFDAGFARAYAGLCNSLVAQIELSPAMQIVDIAENVCRRGVELNPGLIDSHTAYADLYRVTDRPDMAIEKYRWVISQQPRAAEAHLGLGAVYASAGDAEKAENAYRLAIDIRPDCSDIYRQFSAFLFAQGRYREVVEIGRRMIQLDPDDVAGYDTLGDASFASGQFDTAIAAFREVIKREPTSQAFSDLGAGYYYRARYEAAIRMFTRATEDTPLEHRFWGELGDAYTQVGERQAEAEHAYSRARDLAYSERQVTPDNPATVISLAYYCAALNDQACARKHSAEAVALAPAEPAIHYYIALVNLRLGREAAAISAAERALALGYPRALFTVDPMLETVRMNPRLAGMALGQRTLARNANPRISMRFP
jgi:TolB-like protein/DNA-binding winged helix-turn-helix (wHTH) protein/tetratricopeptide (TPR) repeat protein